MEKITTDNRSYCRFTSEYLLEEAGLSPQAFMIWSLLNHRYKKHKLQSDNVIEVYHCFDGWLMEKTGIKKALTLRKYKDELVTKGLLFHKQCYGKQGNWYVPLDPACRDYPVILKAVNTYIKTKQLIKHKWIEKNEQRDSNDQRGREQNNVLPNFGDLGEQRESERKSSNVLPIRPNELRDSDSGAIRDNGFHDRSVDDWQERVCGGVPVMASYSRKQFYNLTDRKAVGYMVGRDYIEIEPMYKNGT